MAKVNEISTQSAAMHSNNGARCYSHRVVSSEDYKGKYTRKYEIRFSDYQKKQFPQLPSIPNGLIYELFTYWQKANKIKRQEWDYLLDCIRLLSASRLRIFSDNDLGEKIYQCLHDTKKYLKENKKVTKTNPNYTESVMDEPFFNETQRRRKNSKRLSKVSKADVELKTEAERSDNLSDLKCESVVGKEIKKFVNEICDLNFGENVLERGEFSINQYKNGAMTVNDCSFVESKGNFATAESKFRKDMTVNIKEPATLECMNIELNNLKNENCIEVASDVKVHNILENSCNSASKIHDFYNSFAGKLMNNGTVKKSDSLTLQYVDTSSTILLDGTKTNSMTEVSTVVHCQKVSTQNHLSDDVGSLKKTLSDCRSTEVRLSLEECMQAIKEEVEGCTINIHSDNIIGSPVDLKQNANLFKMLSQDCLNIEEDLSIVKSYAVNIDSASPKEAAVIGASKEKKNQKCIITENGKIMTSRTIDICGKSSLNPVLDMPVICFGKSEGSSIVEGDCLVKISSTSTIDSSPKFNKASKECASDSDPILKNYMLVKESIVTELDNEDKNQKDSRIEICEENVIKKMIPFNKDCSCQVISNMDIYSLKSKSISVEPNLVKNERCENVDMQQISKQSNSSVEILIDNLGTRDKLSQKSINNYQDCPTVHLDDMNIHEFIEKKTVISDVKKEVNSQKCLKSDKASQVTVANSTDILNIPNKISRKLEILIDHNVDDSCQGVKSDNITSTCNLEPSKLEILTGSVIDYNYQDLKSVDIAGNPSYESKKLETPTGSNIDDVKSNSFQSCTNLESKNLEIISGDYKFQSVKSLEILNHANLESKNLEILKSSNIDDAKSDNNKSYPALGHKKLEILTVSQIDDDSSDVPSSKIKGEFNALALIGKKLSEPMESYQIMPVKLNGFTTDPLTEFNMCNLKQKVETNCRLVNSNIARPLVAATADFRNEILTFTEKKLHLSSGVDTGCKILAPCNFSVEADNKTELTININNEYCPKPISKDININAEEAIISQLKNDFAQESDKVHHNLMDNINSVHPSAKTATEFNIIKDRKNQDCLINKVGCQDGKSIKISNESPMNIETSISSDLSQTISIGESSATLFPSKQDIKLSDPIEESCIKHKSDGIMHVLERQQNHCVKNDIVCQVQKQTDCNKTISAIEGMENVNSHLRKENETSDCLVNDSSTSVKPNMLNIENSRNLKKNDLNKCRKYMTSSSYHLLKRLARYKSKYAALKSKLYVMNKRRENASNGSFEHLSELLVAYEEDMSKTNSITVLEDQLKCTKCELSLMKNNVQKLNLEKIDIMKSLIEKSKKIIFLEDKVNELQKSIEELKTKKPEVVTMIGGRFTQEVNSVFEELVACNVPVEKIPSLIRCTVESLTNLKVSELPFESFLSEMDKEKVASLMAPKLLKGEIRKDKEILPTASRDTKEPNTFKQSKAVSSKEMLLPSALSKDIRRFDGLDRDRSSNKGVGSKYMPMKNDQKKERSETTMKNNSFQSGNVLSANKMLTMKGSLKGENRKMLNTFSEKKGYPCLKAKQTKSYTGQSPSTEHKNDEERGKLKVVLKVNDKQNSNINNKDDKKLYKDVTESKGERQNYFLKKSDLEINKDNNIAKVPVLEGEKRKRPHRTTANCHEYSLLNSGGDYWKTLEKEIDHKSSTFKEKFYRKSDWKKTVPQKSVFKNVLPHKREIQEKSKKIYSKRKRYEPNPFDTNLYEVSNEDSDSSDYNPVAKSKDSKRRKKHHKNLKFSNSSNQSKTLNKLCADDDNITIEEDGTIVIGSLAKLFGK